MGERKWVGVEREGWRGGRARERGGGGERKGGGIFRVREREGEGVQLLLLLAALVCCQSHYLTIVLTCMILLFIFSSEYTTWLLILPWINPVFLAFGTNKALVIPSGGCLESSCCCSILIYVMLALLNGLLVVLSLC